MRNLRAEMKKARTEPRFVRREEGESGRAAAGYSEVLRWVVRGVITMLPFPSF
jgi:hypothetical protein